MRHRDYQSCLIGVLAVDYQSCLIGVLAVYLFWQWHHSGEAFLCFRTSQDWYNVKLLKRDNPHLKEQLNSHTASDWTKRLYSIAGLKMSKVSHAPCQSGAQITELNGVSESQVSFILFSRYSTNSTMYRFTMEGIGIMTR